MKTFNVVLHGLAFVCLVAAGTLHPAPAPASEPTRVLADTMVFRPTASKIQVRWVLPPSDPAVVQAATSAGKRSAFSVDAQGSPWIAFDNRHLLAPLTGARITLSEPFWSMAYLSGGGLLFATTSRLGLMTVPETTIQAGKGFPEVRFQPLMDLPANVERMVTGADNSLYLVTHDEAAKTWSILLLQPEQAPTGPAEGRMTRSFRRLLVVPERVTAVAGDGNITYVAFGRLIVCITGTTIARFNVHPFEDIRDLRYTAPSGLWYATRNGVGLVTGECFSELLRVPEPQLDLRGNTLFVLLQKNLAVLAIDHCDDFRRFAKPLQGLATSR